MAAAGSGQPFYLKVVEESGKKSNKGLYDFCMDPVKFLEKRAEAQKGEATASSAELPPLLMGEWEQIKVPPAEARKDKGAAKLGLKPKLSGLKALYACCQERDKVVNWTYPPDSKLLYTKVKWQDFRSLVTRVSHIFEQEVKEAEEAEKKAAKPPSNNLGGLQVLKEAFDKAQWEHEEKVKAVVEKWATRESEIDKRLADAHDVHTRALPKDKESEQLVVDTITTEQRNFFIARATEKAELEGTKVDRKRKYDSDCVRQRLHNEDKSGRKKMKEALDAAEPMDVEPAVKPASSSTATVGIGAAAAAHDPIRKLAKATAAAAIATGIALYNADL